MHIYYNRRSGAGRSRGCAGRGVEAAAAIGLMLALLTGCASPGPPLPPSLELPEAVSGLAATRVGDEVRLHWTTPSRTTDGLNLAGPMVAEVCRETPSGSAQTSSATAAGGAKSAGPRGKSSHGGAVQTTPRKTAPNSPCSPVLRLRVSPGATDVLDPLPAALTAGPSRLIAYRVQLRNAAGRTAGPSPAVFAASGPSPMRVEDLRGTATKAGVVLEWRQAAGVGMVPETGDGAAIELDRTTQEHAAAAGMGSSGKESGSPAAGSEPAESSFRVGTEACCGATPHAAGGGSIKAGGAVDHTARMGQTYGYTARRVRTVVVGGQTLEVRSLPSASVTVAMLDIFAPDAPAGLVSVPGFAGDTAGQAGDQAQRPTIDLSWDPDIEPRIAGYRVYRRDVGGAIEGTARRITSALVPVAAYRDVSVVAGRRYAYRVTAVDETGSESAPSNEVLETAAAP